MTGRSERRDITDVRALRALADPVRYRLLNHLMSAGPRTASQCAELVGATPSNCSYHLRELQRYGLVERVGPGEPGASEGDGRERLWRAAATGFSFGDPAATDPAAVTSGQALAHARIDENARLAHAGVDAASRDDSPWRDLLGLSDYGLRISADEMNALGTAIDALIRPYIALTRDGAPDDAELVHLSVTAVPLPDRSGP